MLVFSSHHPRAATALGSPGATAPGVFVYSMRICFVVDGFNLYHSVKAAEKHLKTGPLRWLNLHALCQTILQSSFGPGNTLTGVHYFSALATHLEKRKPDVVRRHRTFIAALESTGVEVTLAKFKSKEHVKSLHELQIQVQPLRRWFSLPTKRVRLRYRTHEEKETDVAIACKLLELLCRGTCDGVVLVTGDTDVAPSIRTAQALYPHADVSVAFPFLRYNTELEKLTKRTFKISAQLYAGHQFPLTITGKKGRVISKPAPW